MYYEINVSVISGARKGPDNTEPVYLHFFATSPRSCGTRQEASDVYRALVKAFPAPEFKVTVSREMRTGEDVTAQIAQSVQS